MTYTPRTPEGLRSLDHLPADVAVLTAWTDPGSNPAWHAMTRIELHHSMPLLARALERLEAQHSRPERTTMTTTTAKGFNGTLSFDGQTVTIERKGAGRVRLPLESIKSVEYKKGGLLVGYVKFHTGADVDGRKVRNKSQALLQDPHAVTHQWTSNKAMGELVEEIEAALYSRKEATP